MSHYAGIDVSLEFSSVCVVDGSGKIVREGKAASERAGMAKAKVALARKLAVILHRMLADNVPFNPKAKAAKLAAI